VRKSLEEKDGEALLQLSVAERKSDKLDEYDSDALRAAVTDAVDSILLVCEAVTDLFVLRESETWDETVGDRESDELFVMLRVKVSSDDHDRDTVLVALFESEKSGVLLSEVDSEALSVCEDLFVAEALASKDGVMLAETVSERETLALKERDSVADGPSEGVVDGWSLKERELETEEDTGELIDGESTKLLVGDGRVVTDVVCVVRDSEDVG
jgi:hypothetical protein